MLQKYPLAFIIGLRYNEAVIKAYLPILSKSSIPFLKTMLDYCINIPKEKSEVEKNKYSLLVTDEDPKINSANKKLDIENLTQKQSIVEQLNEKKIMKNLLKTVTFILNKKSNPHLGKYVNQIIRVHRVYTKHMLAQTTNIIPQELKGIYGDLLFEKVGEVESELKSINSTACQIEEKNILLENITKKEIKKKFMKNPTFLNKYDVLTTKFPIDLSFGSKNSIRFFRVVDSMTLEKQSDFDELISYKMNKLKPWLFIQLILFTTLTISYNSFVYLLDKPLYLMISSIILNSIVLIYELKCFITVKKHFNEPGNWADLAVVIGLYFLAPINYLKKDQNKILSIINFFFCLMLNIRSLTYFRVFDTLRYLIEMIIQIYWDIIAFLVVITIFILIYSIGLLGIDEINNSADSTFKDKVKLGIELALGNWDNIPENWTNWNWLLFIGSNVTFTIILLNLIIAIVSKTFDDYYDKQIYVDRKAKLKLILELDQFFKWKKTKSGYDKKKFEKKARFYHILKKKEEVSNIEELGERVKDTERKIEECEKNILRKIESQQIINENIISNNHIEIMKTVQTIEEITNSKKKSLILETSRELRKNIKEYFIHNDLEGKIYFN